MSALRIKVVGNIPDKSLLLISKEQQIVLKTIVKKLKIKAPKQITITLYGSRREMKKMTGYSGNAFADTRSNAIHAFLPKERTSLGFHEMVHILAKPFGKPSRMYSEGLALWFDRSWHGESFKSIVKVAYKKKYKKDIEHIYRDSSFKRLPTKLAYAVSGIVAQKFIRKKGLKAFLLAYKVSSNKQKKHPPNQF